MFNETFFQLLHFDSLNDVFRKEIPKKTIREYVQFKAKLARSDSQDLDDARINSFQFGKDVNRASSKQAKESSTVTYWN